MNNILATFVIALTLSSNVFCQVVAEKLNSAIELSESVIYEKCDVLISGAIVHTFTTNTQQKIFVKIRYNRINNKAVYSHLEFGIDENYDQYIDASKLDGKLQKLRKMVNDIDINNLTKKNLKAHMAYLRKLPWR